MALFSARKRGGNPFAERARARRASQQPPASASKRPQPRSEPSPDPEPEATPEEQRDTDHPLGDLREVAKLAEGGVVESPATVIEDKEPPESIMPSCTCGPGDGCSTVGCKGTPPPEAEQPKRTRGRPRPQETIDRDNAVLAHLQTAHPEGLSKVELAVSLGEKEQQVYSSLRQLSKEGRAENRHTTEGYRWFATG